MKLLISSYSCAPNRGSEHAVGWNWITHAHRLGHQVWALVAPNHEASVTKACQEDPELAGITWRFPTVPGWPLQQAIEPEWERTYNLFWQVRAAAMARRLHAEIGFDVLHHLTWGGVRAPTFLGFIDAPLIVGPVGGGETSPRSLRDAFHPRARITEEVRDLSNHTITINPLVRHGLSSADVIFTKTPDTGRILTPAMQRKSVNFLELGLEAVNADRPPRPPGPPRLLFAGRLLYWKGAHIAIRALAELVRTVPDARLTVVGKGREEARLRADAAALGVAGNVDFVPWLAQQALFELYQTHDLFVFPSLHDSSGNAVLESLSFGLPVVCLDVGGPAQIVTPGSGVIVSTAGRNTQQVATAMAADIAQIIHTPERLQALSAGAAARAAQFKLPVRVSQFYGMVEQMVATRHPIAVPNALAG
ncbi:MAG TPA: glycosyltransferase [Rhodopila sp.]|uniref:glycosyltransferase n=1 Tax=Rhodopila sp. TaxID=2480087 RepID=UPI002CD098A6|nr:glycosyltransferase [Rhodopila sp.]HVY17818.1 glycosyltransferase [Rhodopila sp.]